jgi:RecG-like helicase
MSSLTRWWDRFRSTSEELDARKLRAEATDLGASAIENVVSGQVTTLTGTVRSLILRPEVTIPALEAELFDGSGHISLVWLGRRKIRGIHPGISISVTGRLVRINGQLTMYNPNYAIAAKTGAGE